MERLKHRLELPNKALKTLKISLDKFRRLSSSDMYYDEIRDSTIKRFEYSIDTF